jgi:hypothetical protein
MRYSLTNNDGGAFCTAGPSEGVTRMESKALKLSKKVSCKKNAGKIMFG